MHRRIIIATSLQLLLLLLLVLQKVLVLLPLATRTAADPAANTATLNTGTAPAVTTKPDSVFCIYDTILEAIYLQQHFQ